MISRLRATLTTVTTIGVVTVAAACGSSGSTGPAVTVAQIAQHYDAIAGAYLSGSAQPPQIGTAVEIFNGGAANGVMPNAVSQLIGVGFTRGWIGNVIDLVDSAGADSVQIASFWFTGGVEATLQLFYQNGQFATAFATDSASSQLQDSVAGGVSVSVSPITGTCAFTQVNNVSTQFPTFDPSGSACTFISGTVTADSLLFPQADSSNTAVDFIEARIEGQRLSGVRLQFNSSATFSSAVVHALADLKRRQTSGAAR
jgi:hypothetical protein